MTDLDCATVDEIGMLTVMPFGVAVYALQQPDNGTPRSEILPVQPLLLYLRLQ